MKGGDELEERTRAMSEERGSGIRICHQQGKTAVNLSEDGNRIVEREPDRILRTDYRPESREDDMTPAVVIAVIGANGAGKTTWARANRELLPLPFYNPDAIAEGLGDPDNAAVQARARELVDSEIAEQVCKAKPFGFESTWSSTARPVIVRSAGAQGYRTHAVFLGTATAELNIARVRRRVKEGGHGVPKAEIRRRWRKAFENLLDNWHAFDRVDVLDTTTGTVRLVGTKRDRETWNEVGKAPAWAERIGHAHEASRQLWGAEG